MVSDNGGSHLFTTDRPYSIEYPEPSEPPQLMTFYSFKGGVDRTQSLYNVGVRLAALRRKGLMIDVDLETPGLSIGALDDQERNSKDGFAEIVLGYQKRPRPRPPRH